MNLHPVTFHYKEDGSVLQYGLIAEEVAKVAPDLVQYDKQGKPFTVRYHLLTPMLINELQKAHQEIAELKKSRTEIATLKAQVAEMAQMLKEIKMAQKGGHSVH